MTAHIRHITFDCTDAFTLARFWEQVTGYTEDPDDPNLPDDPEMLIVPPGGGAGLLFVPVPEPKTAKNRIHFDLVPVDRTRDQEVDRLLSIGATLSDDRRLPDGKGWVVLADPEGNEFCVERSAAERTPKP
jgi:catechol 2,3-dioxygenase-like lactoylglutathione lyase family enzyme